MQLYKGSKLWLKNPVISLVYILRDAIIFILPLRRIPSFIIKLLYGIKPKFIFFVHPRRTEDIYMAFPASVLMRRFLGKRFFSKIISLFPPTVISTVKTPQGINGLIVTSPLLSEEFFKNKKKIIRKAFEGMSFGSKLVKRGAVFGLGALWPMITRRGLALKRFAEKKNIIVTNGHCGTLISLFLSIKKMVEISDIPLEELKVAILGAGKMGENLSRILYGKVDSITLIDINEKRLDFVEEKLKKVICETRIRKYTNLEDFEEIKEILKNNHISICTTSNVRRILRSEEIPDNCIIIDDSRPEAIPRNLKGNRIVLEGGLMKIKGIIQEYDFGFGIDENIFGCLAESILLALNSSKTIAPTLGDIDFGNLERMIAFCQKFGIEVGDFKCRDKIIKEDRITSILKNKNI